MGLEGSVEQRPICTTNSVLTEAQKTIRLREEGGGKWVRGVAVDGEGRKQS